MIGIGLYVKHSVEAVELYKKAFGLELGYHVLNDDGSFFHSELMKDGEPVLSVVEGKDDPPTVNPVQFGFDMKDEDELRRTFEVLKEGGRVGMEICELPWSPCAAEVIDRFGIRWYITVPQRRPPDTFTPADMEAYN